jgi:hypothetical protein
MPQPMTPHAVAIREQIEKIMGEFNAECAKRARRLDVPEFEFTQCIILRLFSRMIEDKLSR